jgi:hypothetical protein
MFDSFPHNASLRRYLIWILDKARSIVLLNITIPAIYDALPRLRPGIAARGILSIRKSLLQ